MTLKDLQKIVEEVGGLAAELLTAMRDPRGRALDVLAGPREDRFKTAFRLWGTAALVGLGIQLPLLRMAGVDVSGNYWFHLANVVLLGLIFLSQPIFINAGLWLRGVRSDLWDTIVAYTYCLGIFGPLFSLLNFPSAYQFFSFLQDSGGAEGGVWIAIERLSAAGSVAPDLRSGGLAAAAASVLSPVSLLVFIGLLALCARLMAEHYRIDRYRAVSAVSLGMVIWILPMAGLNMLYLVTVATLGLGTSGQP
jgi:hypothetical protein